MQATRANALTVLTYGCIIDGVVKMPLRASIFTSWLNRHVQLNDGKLTFSLKGCFSCFLRPFTVLKEYIQIAAQAVCYACADFAWEYKK